MEIYKIICTFFGVGKVKFAPGTFGSIAAFPIWFFFDYLFSLFNLSITSFFVFFFFVILLLFFLGLHYSNIHNVKSGKKDASEIVIDEVVGQLIAIYFSYFMALQYLSSNLELVIYFILSFILFRFFDIKKPLFIGLADKKIQNGFGVMIDDVLAGIVSALFLNLFIFINLL
jgi:phosphatidylglycerophosphatase A